MKIIGRKNAVKLREQIEKEIKVVCEKHGLELVPSKGCSFSDDMMTMKVEVRTLVTKSGKSHEQVEWSRFSERFGMTNSDFGKCFNYDRIRYTIVGCRPRSHKYPVIAATIDGKRTRFPAEIVKSLISTETLLRMKK